MIKILGYILIAIVLTVAASFIVYCVRKRIWFFDFLESAIDGAGLLFALFVIGLILITR
ncbi:MAG: hypothetical protein IJT38_01675 [Clostridia bacterium]|nr:hypothetical protein [Clostridia bacterium]